jgi:hypothetical protein
MHFSTVPSVVQVIIAGGLLLAATDNLRSSSSPSSSWRCQAWAPPSSQHRPRSTRLYKAAENSREAVLRKEIAQRNSVLPKKDEERYAIADGEFLEKLNDVESIDTSVPAEPFFASESQGSASTSSSSGAAARIERLTKPRAYPLFLAEKAAELVEATVADFAKTFHLSAESPYSYYEESRGPNGSRSTDKERVVILGTGWGAASFLKAIDTEQYDVTVISPRNYFVFTPMLAGASVGTVEYRSITEPYVP